MKMRKLLLTLPIAMIIFSCKPANNDSASMKENENEEANKVSVKDTTPKVTGIGGIFFYSDNVKASKDWYNKNLGIEMNDWGAASFDSRNINNPDEINSLQWKPFKNGDEYFSPSKKDFMINYQVQNLEGLVNKLRENGVTIVDSVVTYDFGKFVHIMDPEGNKLELWEPVSNDNSDAGASK